MSWSYDGQLSPELELTLPYEKPIPADDDERLTTYILRQKEALKDIDKPFVYFGIGTANECANQTCDSGDIDPARLAEQQYPEKLLEYAKGKGYTPIVINVDDYEGEHFFKALFPLSGYTVCPKGDAAAPAALAEMFGAAIENGGFVVLVNGVADLSPERTNPADGKPSFYLFAGMESVMFGMDADAVSQSFLYVSAFLAERDYYNLYRPESLTDAGWRFACRLGLPEISVEGLLE